MNTSDGKLHKKILEEIAIGTASNDYKGISISYNPEIPPDFSGAYVPSLPARDSETTWENAIQCTAEEINNIQCFVNKLEHLGALHLRKRKELDTGEYFVYYQITNKFQEVYGELDPEGLEIVRKDMQ